MKREELKSIFDALRNDPHHHLGLGDIRLTVAQQDLILDAIDDPLLPAEGAEEVQRCPVCMGRGLVPNSFYATTSGIGSTTQTYLPEKCRTCNGAGVIIPPYPKLQPTAEGAEEILRKPKYNSLKNLTLICEAMTEFATLHAQRLAEKMVEERLRNELMAYDRWLLSHDMGDDFDSTEQCVDEYLKSREK